MLTFESESNCDSFHLARVMPYATRATKHVTRLTSSFSPGYISWTANNCCFLTTLAFWLRSSVVSVLKSIIAFILPPAGQVYYLIFDSPWLRPLLARRNTRWPCYCTHRLVSSGPFSFSLSSPLWTAVACLWIVRCVIRKWVVEYQFLASLTHAGFDARQLVVLKIFFQKQVIVESRTTSFRICL